MTKIRLYNTRTRTKETFEPLDPRNVRMYVCGPTVYDRAHLGNARPVVVFDVLYRLLRHEYGADHVTYVRNFTDVDDKINARAAQTGRPISEITAETTQWFLEDMGALGALEPDEMPRATQYIPQMIRMIEGLIASGHAYEAEGHVLFAVESYAEYGQLSGRTVDDMIAGARVEVAPYKRNPMDFVLWKPSTPDLPGWDSPWGRGRPGWHIECSAMSYELLGPRFDIHGGGNDLMFPHHENEIAQSCCAHPAPPGEQCFAQVWLHNEMLQVEGKKMSKSLGNFFTVRDLLERFDREFAIENIGPALRLRFLQSHYRSPMDITIKAIEDAAIKLDSWAKIVESAPKITDAYIGNPVIEVLKDDLNSPAALTEMDRLAGALSEPFPSGAAIGPDNDRMRDYAWFLEAWEFLGFSLEYVHSLRHAVWSNKLRERATSENSDVEELIGALLSERDEARRNKDWKRADQLRDGIMCAGVKLKDTPDGVEWELSPSFDLSKLESLK